MRSLKAFGADSSADWRRVDNYSRYEVRRAVLRWAEERVLSTEEMVEVVV